jgi:hypothetical protein
LIIGGGFVGRQSGISADLFGINALANKKASRGGFHGRQCFGKGEGLLFSIRFRIGSRPAEQVESSEYALHGNLAQPLAVDVLIFYYSFSSSFISLTCFLFRVVRRASSRFVSDMRSDIFRFLVVSHIVPYTVDEWIEIF